jgi:MGT family glycosyltransferase
MKRVKKLKGDYDATMFNQRKILMVNLPFSGHTNPTLELAKTFVSLGHKVDYVHSPDWKKKIEKTGADFIPYDGYPATLSPSKKEIKSWWAAYRTVKRVGKEYDCLIYEMLFLPGKSLADQLGIPVFRLFSTFTLNEKVLNDFGKTGGWYMTSLFRHPLLYSLVSNFLKRKFNLRYGDIAKEMVDNAPKLNFTYTIKEFQIYPDDFDDKHYKYVGPAVESRDEGNFDFTKMDKPIIYISLGTLLNTSAKFFRKCIKAFQNQPVSVIMSIGNIVTKKQLGKIPDNFFIYTFVPQLKVLQNASLFITHGGMNSVNEALFYGVPMLVIPIGNDQPTVARQVEILHLGKYMDRKNLDARSLQTASAEILGNNIYKDVLKQFQVKSQSAGGNMKIAQQILAELN